MAGDYRANGTADNPALAANDYRFVWYDAVLLVGNAGATTIYPKPI